MSYKAVSVLSDKYMREGCFYTFKSEEEFKAFQLPFADLKHGDKVAIKGCKKVWEIASTHHENVFELLGEIVCQNSVTIRDEHGYYAAINREDITRVLPNIKEIELFLNHDQLALEL